MHPLRILGYKPMKSPKLPDPDAPDYLAQSDRYWKESEAWWDAWSGNFARSLILIPGAAAIILIIIAIVIS